MAMKVDRMYKRQSGAKAKEGGGHDDEAMGCDPTSTSRRHDDPVSSAVRKSGEWTNGAGILALLVVRGAPRRRDHCEHSSIDTGPTLMCYHCDTR